MYANMTMLSEQIWTGGDLDHRDEVAATQLLEMYEFGITHILDLREEWTDEGRVIELTGDIEAKGLLGDSLNIVYKSFGCKDTGKDLGSLFWRVGLKYITETLYSSENKILIHCHMGVNRGPSLACLAETVINRRSAYDVWSQLRNTRPEAWAIYLPEGLRHMNRDKEAAAIEYAIKRENINGDMEKGIGRIRMLQDLGTVINNENIHGASS